MLLVPSLQQLCRREGVTPKGAEEGTGLQEAAEVTKMSAFRSSGNPYVWIFRCMVRGEDFLEEEA